MRRGYRRGQAIADSLRIRIRQDDEFDGPEPSSPPGENGDDSDGPESPSSPGSSGDESDGPESPSSPEFPSPPSSPSQTLSSAQPPSISSATASTGLASLSTAAPSTTKISTVPPQASSTLSSSVPPIIPISTSILSTSSISSLIPTSFETRTSSLPSAPIAGGIILPSKAPVRDGADQPEQSVENAGITQRMGTITGAIIGALGGAVLIVVIILYLRKRRADKRNIEQIQPRDLAGASTRSQKSTSRVLDQVMAAVYSWGDRRSVHKDTGIPDVNWYPQEKQPGIDNMPPTQLSKEPSIKAPSPVHAWLDKLGRFTPSFHASQTNSPPSGKTIWPNAEGRYEQIEDDKLNPREPARSPPSWFLGPTHPPGSQPTYPPKVARPHSVSSPTVISSRYTINSNSTWFRWG